MPSFLKHSEHCPAASRYVGNELH
uniref:Uncharacterized protein n=1 Tax=Anguilla anguilla TaxID=7936 RepID=A0A0E9TQF8_ANGAN